MSSKEVDLVQIREILCDLGVHPKLDFEVIRASRSEDAVEIDLKIHFANFKFCCGELACYTPFLRPLELSRLAESFGREKDSALFPSIRIRSFVTHVSGYEFRSGLHGTNDHTSVHRSPSLYDPSLNLSDSILVADILNSRDILIVEAAANEVLLNDSFVLDNFFSRLGVHRVEAEAMLRNVASLNAERQETDLFVNNSLNELCHGIQLHDDWPHHSKFNLEDARLVLEKWRQKRPRKDTCKSVRDVRD